MCFYAGGEHMGEGARVASTTNRNFESRQGPRTRTHLCSPPMAAAAAVTGTLTDVRKLVTQTMEAGDGSV
jgi:3-isopropylmalate/(R)-2-methylmalate dehydratase large subunit